MKNIIKFLLVAFALTSFSVIGYAAHHEGEDAMHEANESGVVEMVQSHADEDQGMEMTAEEEEAYWEKIQAEAAKTTAEE